MRDIIRSRPSPEQFSLPSFVEDAIFWGCCVFYGLFVGAVVAAVIVFAWMWLAA